MTGPLRTRRVRRALAVNALASWLLLGCGDGAGGRAATNEVCPLGGAPCAGVCSERHGCAECTRDDHCGGATPRCVEGACVACAFRSDCGDQACFPASHTCQSPCGAARDCGGATPICNLTTAACIACLEEGDCGGATPHCSASLSQCVACLDDGDCASDTPRCHMATGTCRACLEDAHCSSQQVCVEGACTG